MPLLVGLATLGMGIPQPFAKCVFTIGTLEDVNSWICHRETYGISFRLISFLQQKGLTMPCVAMIRNVTKNPCNNRTPLCCMLDYDKPGIGDETLAETVVNAYRDTLGVTGEYVNIEWSQISSDSFLLVSYLVDDNGKVDGKPNILKHIVDLCYVPNY